MRILVAFALAVALTCLGILPGYAEKRVALVIGNDRYANLPADQQLQKAVNDANAVGDALEHLGFEVIRGENLGRPALLEKFEALTQRLSPGDTAFFFFSGHGVAINGGNYILPADVPNVALGQEMRLIRTALGETDIVTDLQGRGVRVAVVVLDACRNNPFKRPGGKGVGAERGLGRIEPVQGIFTLYSAGIGQTALDRLGDADDNPNSVFTRVFVPALTTPGLDLQELAAQVRENVAQLAATVQHSQRPAYYDETIGGRVYLAGLPGEDSKPLTGQLSADPCAAARDHWRSAEAIGTSVAFEDHLARFPNCAFATLARARIEELKKTAVATAQPAAPPSGVQSGTGMDSSEGARLTCVRESGDVAIAACTRAIASGDYDGQTLAQLYNYRGLEYTSKRDDDRAIADYNQAIRLDPKYTYAIVNRGLAYSAKKDHDRAIAEYNEAIRLDPKYTYALVNRGLAYSAKKDHDRAIADYDETIRLDSKYAYAFVNRGLAYDAKKDYDRAITDYDEAIRLDPKDKYALVNRGLAYYAKKDYDRAIADYDEAIRLDPSYAYAVNSRARALAAKRPSR